jgi:hypothetical protein
VNGANESVGEMTVRMINVAAKKLRDAVAVAVAVDINKCVVGSLSQDASRGLKGKQHRVPGQFDPAPSIPMARGESMLPRQ